MHTEPMKCFCVYNTQLFYFSFLYKLYRFYCYYIHTAYHAYYIHTTYHADINTLLLIRNLQYLTLLLQIPTEYRGINV